MPIRILLADDHKIIRQGLHSLLKSEPGIEVVGEARDGREAVDMAIKLRPHVVVLDIAMPGLNGIDAAKKIHVDNANIRILALSTFSDKKHVEEMFRAGASGYIQKDCAFEELLQGIKAVAAGQTYVSPAVAGSVIDVFLGRSPSSTESALSQLTSREREVLQLFAEGHSAKEIATELKVSIKTVDTHKQNIKEKLSLQSAADLIKFAIREGLTTLEQ